MTLDASNSIVTRSRRGTVRRVLIVALCGVALAACGSRQAATVDQVSSAPAPRVLTADERAFVEYVDQYLPAGTPQKRARDEQWALELGYGICREMAKGRSIVEINQELDDKGRGNPSVDQRYLHALGAIAGSAWQNLCPPPFARR